MGGGGEKGKRHRQKDAFCAWLGGAHDFTNIIYTMSYPLLLHSGWDQEVVTGWTLKLPCRSWKTTSQNLCCPKFEFFLTVKWHFILCRERHLLSKYLGIYVLTFLIRSWHEILAQEMAFSTQYRIPFYHEEKFELDQTQGLACRFSRPASKGNEAWESTL